MKKIYICLIAFIYALSPLAGFASTEDKEIVTVQSYEEIYVNEIVSDFRLVKENIDIKKTFEFLSIGIKLQRGEKIFLLRKLTH